MEENSRVDDSVNIPRNLSGQAGEGFRRVSIKRSLHLTQVKGFFSIVISADLIDMLNLYYIAYGVASFCRLL